MGGLLVVIVFLIVLVPVMAVLEATKDANKNLYSTYYSFSSYHPPTMLGQPHNLGFKFISEMSRQRLAGMIKELVIYAKCDEVALAKCKNVSKAKHEACIDREVRACLERHKVVVY